MITVRQICNSLGRKEVSLRLGVNLQSVSNAVVAECFPARWYAIIKDMCDEEGLECPESLFAFARGNSRTS